MELEEDGEERNQGLDGSSTGGDPGSRVVEEWVYLGVGLGRVGTLELLGRPGTLRSQQERTSVRLGARSWWDE